MCQTCLWSITEICYNFLKTFCKLFISPECLTGLSALQHTSSLRSDQHDLLTCLLTSWDLLLELHDQLLISRQEVPPGPGVAHCVGCQGHAVV